MTTDFSPDVRSVLAHPLYRRLLGEAWSALPEPVCAMHDFAGERIADGVATVERGGGALPCLLAWTFGFPQTGRDVALTVSLRAQGGKEIWRRTFADRTFSSIQEAGRGRLEGLLCERFGPFRFGMALVVADGRMSLVTRRWSLFGIPMPVCLAPRGNSYEYEEGGRFRFHVEIVHPIIGLIVAYRGWLVPRQR
jgi:hypothetical protein